MVNKLILQGRLVADPELRQTSSGTNVCSFRVAWSENYKETETKLFLSCTAWRGTGEMIAKHFSKGKEIILDGRLSTQFYTDKNGQDRQTTELTVERAHFAGSKADGVGASNQPDVSGAGFAEMDGDDGELPF